MLDVIVIMGIMLSTAGLLSDPCMRRPEQCHEDDACALQQKDALYTAIRASEFDFQMGKVDQQG